AIKFYFRGARIFLVDMEELLEKGMKKAENVKLTSFILFYRKDIFGASYIENYYNDVVMTHV
ncbi:pectin acetylesterase 8-like, partial [Olea europaea subsp. europaea]